ncbi:uncharacterized protein [Solanum tuberosum]|uniref:DUF4408 domain-containing protein n=1 Tax=Solanum tuberosum TaxID=4113 RepID=M0ZJ99_SOLTU|nr:PREDICTED: uncharacterized protein LOC107058498 [Solanum tuberosum]
MESLNFHKIKLEKENAMLRYKKRQNVTILFRFIEFCIFFAIISRFSTRLPLSFKLSIECFKGLGVTLISPRFVFVLGNTIVIILFLKSGHSSGSTNNVKMDLYEQKSSMNYEKSKKQRKVVEKPYCEQSILVEKSYCEQSKKQGKQSILVEKSYREQSIAIEEAYCEQSKKQSILVQRQLVGKKLNRSHSESFTSLSHDEKPRKELIRSATVGCLKVIRTDSVKLVDDEMSSEEFRNTVEAFIARQQRFLREEELFSDVVST